MPALSNDALKRLREFYLAMRAASETEGSPVAITARQLESLVRLLKPVPVLRCEKKLQRKMQKLQLQS